ncbi:ABC transporter ATP-binding protein [Halosimplex amylolyticum]|uniref:ABC transporter ATP-binding protein n=1 Tax=Halosimplex amylolyticum TaxID=3396616 RepID=UPI003F568111
MPEDEDDIFSDEREEIERPMSRLLGKYGRRYPESVLVALAANTVSPLLNLAPAWLLALAIDGLFTESRPYELPLISNSMLPGSVEGKMLLTVALFVSVYALTTLLTWLGSWGWAMFAENVQHDLRTDVYDKMQGLGMEFFSDRQTGELMSVLSSDVNRLEGFLNGWLGQLLNIFVQVVGISAIMLTRNWQLALVALLPAPLLTLVSYFFVKKVRPMYREARGTFGDLASRLENNLSGIQVVKSFTNEPFESGRVVDASEEHKQARWGARRWGIRFGPMLTLINGLGFSLVFFVGGWWLLFGPPLGVFTGTVTVGTVVMFLQYTRQIQGPLTQAGQLLNNFERVKASAERVFVLFDYPVSIPESSDATELEAVRGEVEFDDVSFSYPDGEEALTDVSFTADSGETIGLVGPTGSGKSTSMKLLLRFYDVSEGAVRIDGHDVRDMTIRSLRSSIGYVSQDPFLFTGTVRENIAYGLDASDREIEDVAKQANAHGFITDLEDGYDTEVGQRGDRLSGGQRQRIAIARVLLRDPEILILDEATSHVDNETEVLIQQSLEKLTEDRTTFSIAHRLSTVRDADRILVLEDGEIVERGTHDELLEHRGLYANLWRVQVGEIESLPDRFIEEAAARDRA